MNTINSARNTFLILLASATLMGQASAGSISFRGAITESTCQANLNDSNIDFDKCPNAAHSAHFELQTLRNVKANTRDISSPPHPLALQDLQPPSADRTDNGYFSARYKLNLAANSRDAYVVFVNYN